MFLNERQQDILEFLKQEKKASVHFLAQKFYVSEMTIRRDLKLMECGGYLKRYNGGAVYLEYDRLLPIAARRILYNEEKNMLSVKASKYLKNQSTIYIDSSSTCIHIVPLTAEFKDITIVTNSVMCLLKSAEYHIPCIIAGGMYYEHDMCTIGRNTEKFLENINIDVAFFSSLGLADDGIISDIDENQTSVRKSIMKNCMKKIFLFDKTKLHKKYLYTLCRADEADEIIIL